MGSKNSVKIGWIVSFILICITAGGFIASLFFSWYVVENKYNLPAGCTWTVLTSFKRVVSECTSSCTALITSFCNTDNAWTEDCLSSSDPGRQGTDNCLHQYYIWTSAWGLDITIICLIGVALILYILHVVALIRATSAVSTLGFALLVAIIVLIVFCAGLPPAITEDSKAKSSTFSCSDGPCKEFIGEMNIPGGTSKWTVGTGWILFCASTIFLLIAIIVIATIGRRGDRRVKGKC
jgi:hypothetical protein